MDLQCGAILKLDGSRHTDFDREWPVSGVAPVTRRIAAVAGRAASNLSAHYEEQMATEGGTAGELGIEYPVWFSALSP